MNYHPTTEDVQRMLEARLGRIHARQRLGIERAHEAQAFGQGLNFFHIENWYPAHSVVRGALKGLGLYWRGRRNSEDIRVRRNVVKFRDLPASFHGYTLLHLTDLHVDTNPRAMQRMVKLVDKLDYDISVLTGDFRGRTFGPYSETLDGMAEIRAHLKGEAYGVLGNHDSILMVPELEQMGIRMLMNESVDLVRGTERVHLVGVDDAHFFRADNIEKAASHIDHSEFSILLSHTPEIFRQAAHSDFNFMLCGHTHGGQVCLPGGVAITLDSRLPRRLGAGPWDYHGMKGYTSVGAGTSIVPVRINCPPEITLHRLERE